MHPLVISHDCISPKLSPTPWTDLNFDVVAGLTTKRDLTETPSHRFDHTPIRGEILYTIWMVGRQGGLEGHFSRQFPMPKGSNLSKKKVWIILPFLFYILAKNLVRYNAPLGIATQKYLARFVYAHNLLSPTPGMLCLMCLVNIKYADNVWPLTLWHTMTASSTYTFSTYQVLLKFNFYNPTSQL